jgi:hypothetical protein
VLRLLPLLLLAGCGAFDTGTVARREAARALDCAEDAVSVEETGYYRYRGVGCAGRVDLACSMGRRDPVCLIVDGALAAVGGEEAAPVASEAEVAQAIRTRLEGRRDDLLACAGAARLAVRVTYAADGSVVIALQGERSGSPEEACVRDVLRGARLPPPGRGGVVVHLLR